MSATAFICEAFMSFNAKAKVAVRPLAQRLRQDDRKVWFDDWECPSPKGATQGDQRRVKIEAPKPTASRQR